MASLWLEVDDEGRIHRRSEEVQDLFAAFDPRITDFARLMQRRADIRAAVLRRAGFVRFALGRGPGRITFDAELDAGGSGARMRLTQVDPLADEFEVGRLLLAHSEVHPDAVTIMDADGVVLWCDRSFLHLVGRSREEIVGSHSRVYRSPVVTASSVEAYWRALYATGSYSGDTFVRRSDGVDIPVHSSVVGVRDEDGRTTHYVALLHDSTREREMARLRSIDLAVTLLSRVSGEHAHHLNNLAAEIVAVCDRAMLSDDPASAGQALDRVLQLGGELGALGRQMLSLSTSGRGTGPSDLGKVAHDLAATLGLAAGDDGPRVEMIGSSLGPWVNCPPDSLVRACIHLALRSLEGVAPGSVVEVSAVEDYDDGLLRIRYTPTASERSTLRWLLPDGAVTGPLVNEQFGRAYGAGVELSLEEEHDGRVAICVRAPIAEVVPGARPKPPPAPTEPYGRALVVDDNDALRGLMAAEIGRAHV